LRRLETLRIEGVAQQTVQCASAFAPYDPEAELHCSARSSRSKRRPDDIGVRLG
jgi:hypothetical protein